MNIIYITNVETFPVEAVFFEVNTSATCPLVIPAFDTGSINLGEGVWNVGLQKADGTGSLIGSGTLATLTDGAVVVVNDSFTVPWQPLVMQSTAVAGTWPDVDVDMVESGFWWMVLAGLPFIILWSVRQMKSINFNQP